MRRIKLIVAYDGTNYCGWQVQPNGITVQEVLNQALSDLLRRKRPASAQAGPTPGYMLSAMLRYLIRMRECRRTVSHLHSTHGFRQISVFRIIRSAARLSPAFYRNSQNI